MSENGKEPGSPPGKSSEDVQKSSESDSVCKKYPELFEDDEVVKRQMEMISESLAACKRISKRRSPKKDCDVPIKSQTFLIESSMGNPPNDRKGYHDHQDGTPADDYSPVFSYILREKSNKNDERGCEMAENREEEETRNKSSTDLETFSSPPESRPVILEKIQTSEIGIYKPEEVDPIKMMEIIQRELKTLLKMAPTVASTITELFDAVLHYQTCPKCNVKIRSSLPWILKTIQELVKHVTKKKRVTYVWPSERNYFRLSNAESAEENLREKKEEVGKDTKPGVVIGKLEKVNAITTFASKPGVQIQLEVKPEETKKKFYSKKIQIPKYWDISLKGSYPIERPREFSYNFLLRVEKPSLSPKISWIVKRNLLVLRGVGSAIRFVPRFKTLGTLSAFVLIPVSLVTSHQELESYLEEVTRDTLNVVEHLGTEEDEMQFQKVKELEAEVKGLKDLMLEVHENQKELSKVLVEKGVCSPPIVRLTDPKMLEEENEVVRKAAEMEITRKETHSVEMLQSAVDDLKRKCAIKNRMIVTLLKQLRTDVSNEWCEELVEYFFADPKPVEELDPEMVTEFFRRASAYRLNKNKFQAAGRPSVKPEEDLPSEEEGHENVKRNPEVKWNIKSEDLLSTTKEVSSSCDMHSFLDCQTALNFFTYPASVEFETKSEVVLKKLENQIFLLNAENGRLWNEIKELRSLLKASVEGNNEIRDVISKSSKGFSDVIKTSGKTINLTIQIGDKDSRCSDRNIMKNQSVKDWSLERGKSKSTPVVKCTSVTCDDLTQQSSRPNLSEHERRIQQKFMTDTRYKIRSKPNGNCSDVDLNCLEDTSPNIPNYVRLSSTEDNERLHNFLRDNIESVHHVMVATPRPSQHSLDRVLKLPTNISEAGPSKGHGSCLLNPQPPNITNLFPKPSITQLIEKQSHNATSLMTNERELQTIPENDSAFLPAHSGQTVDQALEALRAKVKSIYKDVSVLKTKNDRMDKLLDKLLEDALENNQSFEEIENEVNGLKERFT